MNVPHSLYVYTENMLVWDGTTGIIANRAGGFLEMSRKLPFCTRWLARIISLIQSQHLRETQTVDMEHELSASQKAAGTYDGRMTYISGKPVIRDQINRHHRL